MEKEVPELDTQTTIFHTLVAMMIIVIVMFFLIDGMMFAPESVDPMTILLERDWWWLN